MRPTSLRSATLAAIVIMAASPQSTLAQNWAAQQPPYGRPDATIDLRTNEGVDLVKGQWRYSDAQIIEVDSRGPGADLKPSGAPVRTYDYTPHAGVAGFDDAKWEAIAPTTLDARRSGGKACFNWYRIHVTIPEKLATLSTTGTTVAFEIVVDDYAEVWVNGKLPAVLGQSGGSVVKGFNAPNRVILTHQAEPGEQFEIAVFGFNGPVSRTPENFIWVKSATLDFYKSGHGTGEQEVETKINRLDPALDALVSPGTKIKKVARAQMRPEMAGFRERALEERIMGVRRHEPEIPACRIVRNKCLTVLIANLVNSADVRMI